MTIGDNLIHLITEIQIQKKTEDVVYVQLTDEMIKDYQRNINHSELVYKFCKATYASYDKFTLVKGGWTKNKELKPTLYLKIIDDDDTEWTIEIGENIHEFKSLSVDKPSPIIIRSDSLYPGVEQRKNLATKYSNIISNIEDRFEVSWHDIIHREHV